MSTHLPCSRGVVAGVACAWLAALACGCGRGAHADEDAEPRGTTPAPSTSAPPGVVVTHVPQALTGIASGVYDPNGHQANIACATCHGIREEPHELPTSAEELGGPHAGLDLSHGDLSCRSCHHPDRYDQLRLADGRAVPLPEVMRLCSQCHGPQARDYANGSHGGMRGHWDLSRGGRVRNNCVDCHDSHAPAFPQVSPAPPPRDRFLPPPGPSEQDHD